MSYWQPWNCAVPTALVASGARVLAPTTRIRFRYLFAEEYMAKYILVELFFREQEIDL
jgi:hypothetical protein